MSETPENRLKRLKMRSWRRGLKEMDLILGTFCEGGLRRLSGPLLDVYESLLDENDHDLYQWMSGQRPRPAEYLELMALIYPVNGGRLPESLDNLNETTAT